MIVYRLEDENTGIGPFHTLKHKAPELWRETHDSPTGAFGDPINDTLKNWLDTVIFATRIPGEFKFSFSTLDKLLKSFPGYSMYPNLIVMACTINSSEKENICILDDGQVLFSKLLDKTKLIINWLSSKAGVYILENNSVKTLEFMDDTLILIDELFEDVYETYLNESGWNDEYHTDSEKDILLESFSPEYKIDYINTHCNHKKLPDDFYLDDVLSAIKLFNTK